MTYLFVPYVVEVVTNGQKINSIHVSTNCILCVNRQRFAKI